MAIRFWRRRGRETDDLSDVHAPPRVAISLPESQAATALDSLAEPGVQVAGEVLDAERIDGGRIIVTLGHRYERRTALLRRLNAFLRAGVQVHDFAWLDPVTAPHDRWLEDAFDRWETGRHRDADRMEPIEVARRRFGRLHGYDVLDRLLQRVSSQTCEQRRRWTIAHAAVLTGFNTHTTEAGDALVASAVTLADVDAYASMRLLDGAGDIANLSRFGVHTYIVETPLIPLLEHGDWQVHGAATRLLAALPAPVSDSAADVLVRLGHHLASGSKSTEVRAEQVVDALATAADERTDVDDALDALRTHTVSSVRVAATTTLARRRPERARGLWEPWLTSRSFNERTAAESMIAGWGDERDVHEVVRIVGHRTKPPQGTTYWPPLAAEPVDFLVRHSDVPEAAAALDRLRERWDRHDDDLRRWLRLHHPDLAPTTPDDS